MTNSSCGTGWRRPKWAASPGTRRPLRDWLEQVRINGKPWDKTPPAPHLPREVIEKTAAKYREALERLTT